MRYAVCCLPAAALRIDKIDNEGIVNGDTGLGTQKLRIIKGIFNQPSLLACRLTEA